MVWCLGAKSEVHSSRHRSNDSKRTLSASALYMTLKTSPAINSTVWYSVWGVGFFLEEDALVSVAIYDHHYSAAQLPPQIHMIMMRQMWQYAILGCIRGTFTLPRQLFINFPFQNPWPNTLTLWPHVVFVVGGSRPTVTLASESPGQATRLKISALVNKLLPSA